MGMNRFKRFSLAVLLAMALPIQAWAAAAAPCAWAKGKAAAATSGLPDAAPAPLRAGGASAHCGHGPVAATPAGSARTGAGTDRDACHLACGHCHSTCGAMAAPLLAGIHDALRPVLNASAARADLSISPAHAPPPPRS